jgi:hypothetical protein
LNPANLALAGVTALAAAAALRRRGARNEPPYTLDTAPSIFVRRFSRQGTPWADLAKRWHFQYEEFMHSNFFTLKNDEEVVYVDIYMTPWWEHMDGDDEVIPFSVESSDGNGQFVGTIDFPFTGDVDRDTQTYFELVRPVLNHLEVLISQPDWPVLSELLSKHGTREVEKALSGGYSKAVKAAVNGLLPYLSETRQGTVLGRPIRQFRGVRLARGSNNQIVDDDYLDDLKRQVVDGGSDYMRRHPRSVLHKFRAVRDRPTDDEVIHWSLKSDRVGWYSFLASPFVHEGDARTQPINFAFADDRIGFEFNVIVDIPIEGKPSKDLDTTREAMEKVLGLATSSTGIQALMALALVEERHGFPGPEFEPGEPAPHYPSSPQILFDILSGKRGKSLQEAMVLVVQGSSLLRKGTVLGRPILLLDNVRLPHAAAAALGVQDAR